MEMVSKIEKKINSLMILYLSGILFFFSITSIPFQMEPDIKAFLFDWLGFAPASPKVSASL